jgi:hypothetical protein
MTQEHSRSCKAMRTRDAVMRMIVWTVISSVHMMWCFFLTLDAELKGDENRVIG